MPNDFSAFFHAATGNAPYDYQSRLAGAPTGRVCESQIIAIPTGLGKTAAVVLAWLWNRIAQVRSDWPRRLVYCLPMRALVDQTETNARKWIDNLLKQADALGLSETSRSELAWLAAHSPVILMGGEELDSTRRDWDLHPERPAILIGTQDMLLSRALNRGYGMNRYRWPMHFALLNHDALWVLDETQLIGVGIETSAQLDAFRRTFATSSVRAVTPPRAFTWWMSATLSEVRLETVDQPKPLVFSRSELTSADHNLVPVARRFTAAKPIAQAPDLKRTSISEAESNTYARQVAALVHSRHSAGTFTLVVLNSVVRAQAVYRELLALKVPAGRLALVHSRFRPDDRARQQQLLYSSAERIVVATQAVEAGVDVSARLLVTELAPWSSLVQRFGRCNRVGTIADAAVIWIDQVDDDQIASPYTATECAAARMVLQSGLQDVSPQSLAGVSPPIESRVIRPVLRRKDLLDLFDTSPDLAGNDLDISRYVRDGEDNDVLVFWRELGSRAPDPDQSAPSRAELCAVSLPRFRAFFDRLSKKEGFKAYVWDLLDAAWRPSRGVRAGETYLLDCRAGGYSADLGWTGDSANTVQPLTASPATAGVSPEANGTDCGVRALKWLTLAEHTAHVIDATHAIARALELPATTCEIVTTAARWHDIGKAHAIFQNALRSASFTPPSPDAFYAKSPGAAQRYAMPGFRHELASALAVLLGAPPELRERDLVAYLVAAHHGKVRLSIRSMPGEGPPPGKPSAHCARGVVDGDLLPAHAFVELGLGTTDIVLDVGFMELGEGPHGPSWLSRSLALRERFGPFQLSYLETLLRAADMRSSAAEAQLPEQP